MEISKTTVTVVGDNILEIGREKIEHKIYLYHDNVVALAVVPGAPVVFNGETLPYPTLCCASTEGKSFSYDWYRDGLESLVSCTDKEFVNFITAEDGADVYEKTSKEHFELVRQALDKIMDVVVTRVAEEYSTKHIEWAFEYVEQYLSSINEDQWVDEFVAAYEKRMPAALKVEFKPHFINNLQDKYRVASNSGIYLFVYCCGSPILNCFPERDDSASLVFEEVSMEIGLYCMKHVLSAYENTFELEVDDEQ